MSSSGLPAPAAAVELARVAPDDARYILCWNDSVIVGGSRSAICEALAADDGGGLIAHLTDDLFAVVDEFGGNSSRTAWGIGRHVAHKGEGEDGFVVPGMVTGENFTRLVDDVESGESLRQNYGEIDPASFGYTALATFYAAQSILDEVTDLFGEPYDMMPYNGVSAQFIYDGLRRLDLLDIEASISELYATAPVGVVSWDFQAVLADIGLAALVKRYSGNGATGVTAADAGVAPAGESDVRDIDFSLDASQPRELAWWIAASAFLLADVRLGDKFSDRAVAVAAGNAVVREFVTFDPWDIVRAFTTADRDGVGADDVRVLLRRCVAGGYPLAGVVRMLRADVSVEELFSLMDSGVDFDLAESVVA